MTCCGSLTPEEVDAIKLLIAEAEKAYHQLMIGGGVAAFTDQNGERVEYRASNKTGLISYINWLRMRIGEPPMCGIVSAPAGVYL